MLDNNIVPAFMLIWLFVTLIITCRISLNIKEGNIENIGLIAIKNFILNLFDGRNFFGIILSLIFFIIAVPSILMILFIQLLFYIVIGMAFVWRLGQKKEK